MGRDRRHRRNRKKDRGSTCSSSSSSVVYKRVQKSCSECHRSGRKCLSCSRASYESKTCSKTGDKHGHQRKNVTRKQRDSRCECLQRGYLCQTCSVWYYYSYRSRCNECTRYGYLCVSCTEIVWFKRKKRLEKKHCKNRGHCTRSRSRSKSCSRSSSSSRSCSRSSSSSSRSRSCSSDTTSGSRSTSRSRCRSRSRSRSRYRSKSRSRSRSRSRSKCSSRSRSRSKCGPEFSYDYDSDGFAVFKKGRHPLPCGGPPLQVGMPPRMSCLVTGRPSPVPLSSVTIADDSGQRGRWARVPAHQQPGVPDYTEVCDLRTGTCTTVNGNNTTPVSSLNNNCNRPLPAPQFLTVNDVRNTVINDPAFNVSL